MSPLSSEKSPKCDVTYSDQTGYPFNPHFLNSNHTKFPFTFSADPNSFLLHSLCGCSSLCLGPSSSLSSTNTWLLRMSSSFKFQLQVQLREIFSNVPDLLLLLYNLMTFHP